MKTFSVLLLLAFCVAAACAKEVLVSNVETSADINAKIAGLEAGDSLRFAAGTYTDVSLVIDGIEGTADKYITISGVKGAAKPVIIADADGDDENYCLRLRSGVKYLKFQDIEFRHTDGAARVVAGVYFGDDVHDVEFSNIKLRDITGVGIQMHDQDDIYNIKIKDCEFHNIGIGEEDVDNLGSAITAGAQNLLNIAVKNVHDIEIDHCIFHDINGAVGNAIAFTNGVYKSVISDNVVWECPKGFTAATHAVLDIRPGLKAASNKANNIVVKGNAILDSAIEGIDSVAVSLSGGVDLTNNLIYNCNNGIAFSLLATLNLKNTRCAHNTVFKVSGNAMAGLFTGLEDSSFVVANNVLYVGDEVGDLIGYTWESITSLGKAVVKNNFYRGKTVVGQVFADLKAMISLDGDADSYFKDGNAEIGAGANFVAKGELLKAGIDVDIDVDFDGNERDEDEPDCGCYQADGNHGEINYDYKAAVEANTGDGDDGSAANSVQSAMINLF